MNETTNISNIPIVLHTMDSYSDYWDNWFFYLKNM